MAEIFSGIVCGYALALLATPLAAVALIRMRVNSEWLRHVVPVRTPLLAWSLIMHSIWLMTLTAMGMALGLLLHGIERRQPDGGLGSPNAAFTLVVIAIAAIAIFPMAVAIPRWRVLLIASGLVFAGTFGWIMPYLSLIGPNRN